VIVGGVLFIAEGRLGADWTRSGSPPSLRNNQISVFSSGGVREYTLRRSILVRTYEYEEPSTNTRIFSEYSRFPSALKY
jgi:hypothetical protein